MKINNLKKSFYIPFLLFVIYTCSPDDKTQVRISGGSFSLDVTNINSSDYILNGKDRNGNISGNDPDLIFYVGDTVNFFNNTILPFYLKTTAGTGSGNAISGITNNGTTNQTISWTPTITGIFYYQCSFHIGMVGCITIQ